MLRTVTHFLIWLLGQINGILHLPMWLYYTLQSPKKCPPAYDDIYFMPATIIAQKIRDQEVTSVYVMSMYIKRAKEVNKIVNGIVQDRFELAMKESQHADDFVINSGLTKKELEEKYPLMGVPLTVKECIAVDGMSFSVGSKIRPRIATRNADTVEMLKAAGAIVYLVTSTPELCLNWETFNYIIGRTVNPYDSRRSSGGSSGGEAVLLATCGSLIGLGSDLVGSGRGPPNFCGVYGHRSSSYLTSNILHDPYVDHHGLSLCPLTRYAIDLPLMLKCMIPPGKVNEIKLLEEFEPKQIRVYYMFGSGSNYPTSKVDSQIVTAIQKVATHLHDDGFFTENVQIKSFADQFDITFINLLNIKGAYEALSYKDISIFAEIIRTLFGCARVVLTIILFEILYGLYKLFSTQKQVDHHLKLLSEMKTEVEELLGDDGVLLYPTYPNVALIHGRVYAKTMDSCYMGIFNMLDLPSLVIPIGKNSNGLPIGVQVVAKERNDRLPMILARYLEVTYGGWTTPPYSTSGK